MKFKTTTKAIKNNYSKNNIISLGYCSAYHLLKNYSPIAYTSGVYGWNYDVYEINGVCVCTGYRGMPNGLKVNYKNLEALEKRAEKLTYSEVDNAIREKLLLSFIDECKGE